MKKAFLSVALALAVAGSWAFYPKAPAEDLGYTIIIGQLTLANEMVVTTISPNGEKQSQSVKAKITQGNIRESTLQLHQTEVNKLNELRKVGYKLVNTTQSIGSTGPAYILVETIYVLEK